MNMRAIGVWCVSERSKQTMKIRTKILRVMRVMRVFAERHVLENQMRYFRESRSQILADTRNTRSKQSVNSEV